MFKKQTCRIFCVIVRLTAALLPSSYISPKVTARIELEDLQVSWGVAWLIHRILKKKKKRKKEWYKQQHHLCRSDGLDYVVKLH